MLAAHGRESRIASLEGIYLAVLPEDYLLFLLRWRGCVDVGHGGARGFWI